MKKLRKEQQKLQKIVKRFRIKIKEILAGKVPDKTPETVNATVQTKSYEGRATGTQTKPIPTQPLIIQKEQHAILVDVATKTEDVPSYSMATHMEVCTSHNKEIQTENILSHSISTQKD